MKNRKQREQETRDPVIGQLQQMMEGFQSSSDQLASNISANVRSEVQHQIQMMMGKYGKKKIDLTCESRAVGSDVQRSNLYTDLFLADSVLERMPRLADSGGSH